MKRQIGIVMAVWLITSACLHADSSYVLIQGPFGSGGSELSYKWQINYPAGDLVTGQDLLNSVFGTPVATGSNYTDTYGTYPEYEAGNSSQGVEYAYYPSLSEFGVLAFTLSGTTVLQDTSTNPSWNYYVAGGSGTYNGGPYTSGTWNFSNDGQATRQISNGSFDGWVFGDPGYTDGTPTMIDNSSGTDAPDPSTFSETTPTNFFMLVSVPEPGAPVLAAVALGGLMLWKRKGRA